MQVVKDGKPIRLGNIVKDSYTGFQGVFSFYEEWLYGCNRVGIAPTELKDGVPQRSQIFDEQRVEFVSDGYPYDDTPGPAAAISLGSDVRDKVTGFEGFASVRVTNLNSTALIGIESRKLKEGKPIEMPTFDEGRVELVKPEKPIVNAGSKARTGGPQRPYHSVDGRF